MRFKLGHQAWYLRRQKWGRQSVPGRSSRSSVNLPSTGEGFAFKLRADRDALDCEAEEVDRDLIHHFGIGQDRRIQRRTRNVKFS
jgi:hypothetical protein